MRILRVSLVLMMVMCCLGCQLNKCMVVAHRGASSICDENSLAAVEKAVEIGVDAIEIDVWRTVDDSLVVFHDRNTKRLMGDSLVIPQSKSENLRKLRLPQGGCIPFLGEVLKKIPHHITLFIEIKCCWENGDAGQLFPMLKKQVQKCGKMNQIAMISFNIEKLKESKNQMPHVPCYWLCYEKDKEEQIINKAVEYHLDGIDVNAGIVTPKLMKMARDKGLKVFVWTVDDPQWARKLEVNYGVDGITTNQSELVKRAIRNKMKIK